MAQKLGAYAFLIGIIIAILAGIAAGVAPTTVPGDIVALIILILGLIVGFLNIGDKEITAFLVAAIALIAAAGLANFIVIDTLLPPLGTLINAILSNIVTFVAPAAIVVALKAVWNLASGT